MAGWQKLEATLSPGGEPGRCLVAMSFDPRMDFIYDEGIEPGIKMRSSEHIESMKIQLTKVFQSIYYPRFAAQSS